MRFAEWEAAIAAGATLEELNRLEAGYYPTIFRARLIAWKKLHDLVLLHSEAASQPKPKGAGL